MNSLTNKPTSIRVRYIQEGKHIKDMHSARYEGKSNPENKEKTYVWLGKPIPAPEKWTCGADIVWPVLKIEGHPDMHFLETPYVCRHMIEIGD